MTWGIVAGTAASAASAGVQASAGKKGAEAAADANLAGLGQANQTIREAMAQYDPYRRMGGRADRQLQRFYGYRPEGGDPDAPRQLTSKEARQLRNLVGADPATLSPSQRRRLKSLGRVRDQRRQYREDFDLARTVGQDEEQALLGLEEGFAKEEEDIFGRQEGALRDYTARNERLDREFMEQAGGLDTAFKADVAGLDARYTEDVGALDRGFKTQTVGLDDAYYAEERALRDKIAKGDVTIDPGYKFRLEQGKLARERGAAARGGLLSGGHLKDLEEYSQGLASQEFGAATQRMQDLYGLGQGNFQMRRGNIVGDYERGRGYKTGDYTLSRGYKTGDYERGRGYLTGDYTRSRDYGRTDYGDVQDFLGQSLANRRSRFDQRYAQGMDRRSFELDRFNRRRGGAERFSDRGFQALGQQTGLSQTLANLYGQAGQVRGEASRAPYDALGQFGGSALNDISMAALFYGLRNQEEDA